MILLVVSSKSNSKHLYILAVLFVYSLFMYTHVHIFLKNTKDKSANFRALFLLVSKLICDY